MENIAYLMIAQGLVKGTKGLSTGRFGPGELGADWFLFLGYC